MALNFLVYYYEMANDVLDVIMKRKRLNHFSDAVVGILTGYQAILNFEYFRANGEGRYVLDFLTGRLSFNGVSKDRFPIFENLLKWFNNEVINTISTNHLYSKHGRNLMSVNRFHMNQFESKPRSGFF